MAKVLAPLFGFSASGKLADSLVYMKWKGLHTVRQYVIPANPKSDDQKTQRGFMSAAINKWHSVSWNALDLAAWNRYAATLAKIMSGFNAFVKNNIDASVAGLDYHVISEADFSAVTDVDGEITMKLLFDRTTYLYVGTKKTVFPLSFLGVHAGETVTFTLAGLIASTKYYCYAKNTSIGSGFRTGLYEFETTA